MCGIAGQVRFDGSPVSRPLLETMCHAIEHRGPDSRGIHVHEGVGLGIQRLRVIDLETGDQPIFNEDRSVAVVLNGEIYNFRELRRSLVASGHTFTTQGDTEVIVHLYEEHGPDCVRHLHGMFAFALWDARRRRLVVGRDRAGKKPLFYAHDGRVLSFSSELPSLVSNPSVSRDLDPQALDGYFAFRWVPAPRTAYRAIRKLPPASTLVFDEGGVRVSRYWRLDFSQKRSFASRAAMHEEIRDQIRRAVRRRLVSDVPLGAFLSGGIDSTAVVAAMAESVREPVKTFSIGFANEEYNELPQARLVAERYGTDHHEHVVEPDAVEIIPKIVRHYGEPFADASAVPSFYVAEMARRHVTVALNGDGGDETFAGYTRYAANRLVDKTGRLPAGARRALGRMGQALPASGRKESWTSRIRRVSATIALDSGERYLAYMSNLDGLDRDRLYSDEYRAWIGESDTDDVILGPWGESTAPDVVDRMLDVDTLTYLPDDLLYKMDIATMAYSLEARSPLLDHEFMEFAASLPSSDKLAGTRTKAALRDALRGWIPDEILDAPKRGFRLPMHDWFRGELREYAREVLLDRAAVERGFFQPKYIDSLLREHAEHVADHAQAIWSLLMFELWHQSFVDAPGQAPSLVGS